MRIVASDSLLISEIVAVETVVGAVEVEGGRGIAAVVDGVVVTARVLVFFGQLVAICPCSRQK